MRFLSYKFIKEHQNPELDVPGQRIPMRQEDLFAIWVAQHEYALSNIITSEEGHSVLDVALAAFVCYPELIEERRN